MSSKEAAAFPAMAAAGDIHEEVGNTSEVLVVPPDEIHSPPSPRRQIETFLAANPNLPKIPNSSPLERFLAQQNGLMVFDSEPQRLQAEWGRLRALRASTLRARGKLRQLRKELHRRDGAKDSADNSFIKYVRELQSGQSLYLSRPSPNPEDPILEAHYAAIQEARDEYGPIYDEYNNLEDFLDQQEFEMAKVESRLYSTTIDETPDSTPPLTSLMGLSSESPPELPPSHMKYLSRLGDLDLARERHQNMVEERDSLLYSQVSRSIGSHVYESERHFLDDFPAQEAKILGDIFDIEVDVERQRQTCLEEGIELSESSVGDLEDSDVVPTSPSEHASIEPSMFTLLSPKSVEKKGKLNSFITDFDEANKSNRINRWLRYQLQSSPLEVEHLIRVSRHLIQDFDLRHFQRGIYHWQVCVASWWERDDANRSLEITEIALAKNSMTQSLSSTIEDANDVSEKTMKLFGAPPALVRVIRSAPSSLDLERVFMNEVGLRAKAVSTPFCITPNSRSGFNSYHLKPSWIKERSGKNRGAPSMAIWG
ncbi:hypothetical protein D0Z07_7158 [Hyphodiscus hymeniophilus]|uniref:Uncharacterized protein n=1 Tax=Hyphodiscus hymeniophilus TaxID=353542 RepID=A0A9P6VFX5_9HELO|nr:hypothetical protein D0Z07_7158 [Hyphodiscus hymeniophilus]